MSEYNAPWTFVIDTDGKAWVGNFERELCAYCTGMIGECGKGSDEAEQFFLDFNILSEDESPFVEAVNYVMDDGGCERPVAIYPGGKGETPGKTTHTAVAIFFHEKPTDELIAIMKERAYRFAKERPDGEKFKDLGIRDEIINITGFRLIEQIVSKNESRI